MANEMKLVYLKPGDIIVGDRFRKDFGDIRELATSLKEDGPIAPILIDTDYNLVAGERRLRAMKSLKWKMVPCLMMDIKDPTRIQIVENAFRKDWTPDEKMDIVIRLTEHINGKRRSDDNWAARVAGVLGWKEGTVRKARTIAEASRTNPKRFAVHEAKIRRTGKVNGAYKDYKRKLRESFGHETVYNGVTFRSTTEARWAAFFDLLKIEWDYEPPEFPTWLPDFLIRVEGEKRLVEVKAHTDFEFLMHELGKIEESGCDCEVWKVGGRMFGKWPPHPEENPTQRVMGLCHDFGKEPDCPRWRPLLVPMKWEEHWKSACTKVQWKPNVGKGAKD